MPAKRPHPPTVRLRRLAAELRRLRAEAGLTREDVTRRTGINEATLYRIERSRARPQRRTLVSLLDTYRADEAHRTDLLALQSGANDQGWLRPYHSELPEEYTAYIGFEAEARTVRNYESLFVPGLAQTEQYATEVVRGVLPVASRKEVAQRVQARMERQALLTGERPLQLRAIVDEAALRRAVGGREVMRGQARHLLALMAEPHVTFQVIPFEKGAHAGMTGSFVHMDFPHADDPGLVYLDTPAGDLFLESETEIRRYKSMFEHLQAVALGPDDSAGLLARVAEE
ncbi:MULTISPECIES: helix-turn-helix transcriptional regulator [unclassified Streptomyces]|uniref:helix-turn-helix domain-containing protein n=1 Tax=unclassified Streptomyces TaxID=2593676 RepID=UPI001E5562C9|nr:helix-turn-helix transcriptional regulator [Streptomyces sp. CB02980]MCB8906326.1 helix-turn-helix domain-containing protein [Streptomyces sp. CB02980]